MSSNAFESALTATLQECREATDTKGRPLLSQPNLTEADLALLIRSLLINLQRQQVIFLQEAVKLSEQHIQVRRDQQAKARHLPRCLPRLSAIH